MSASSLGAAVLTFASLAASVLLAQHVSTTRRARHRLRDNSGRRRRRWWISPRRRVRRLRAGEPAQHWTLLLEHTARRVAGGETLGSALRGVAVESPLAMSLSESIRAMQRGASVEEALGLARPSASDADSALAVHVLTLCATDGGAIAEALDRAAATLRERDAMAHERHAQSAQARLSAIVLTCLPVGFAIWSTATSVRVRAFVVTTPGVTCLIAGALLNVAGWLAMRRLIGATT